MDLRQQTVLTLLIFCGFVWIQSGLCATGTDAKNLRTQLFVTDGYDRKVRPLNNQSDPIEVYVNLYLLSINGLNEVTETLKTTGYLWVLWHDDFLQWDPNNYGGIYYYLWPQGDVWKPDVALKNSFLEYKELGVASLNVLVSSNGEVEWFPFQVFQSTCSLNIKYYPFDVQECKLKFVALSYAKEEVDMVSGSKGIVMDEFESNSEWEVLDTSYSVDDESGESSVVFTIKMKRKPLYNLLSVIMPIIMLAVLNIFVFILPNESGEKASYAITVFLAFAVFLSIISASFPNNSEVVAVFSAYVIILTIQSTFITLLALVLIRCSAFDEEETPVPKCMQAFLRVVSFSTCRKSIRKKGNKVAEEATHEEKVHVKSKTSPLPVVEAASKVTSPDYTWREFGKIMDRILFIFFSTVLITVTMIFFILTVAN